MDGTIAEVSLPGFVPELVDDVLAVMLGALAHGKVIGYSTPFS